MGRILAVLMCLLVTACTDAPQPAVQNTAASTVQTGSFDSLFQAERQSRGLGGMARNAQLKQAALGHAQDMVSRGYFAHQSPSGSTLVSRARAAGYCYSRISENIAQGQRSEGVVMQSWLTSPGHFANMVDPRVSEYGFAQVNTTWVLVMGAPC